MQIGVAGQHLASESALGCFQPEGLLQPTSWKLAAWTGCKFKVQDLLDSARLEGLVQGLQICNILHWSDVLQSRPAVGFCRFKTCSLNPVQIGAGVAGQPLAVSWGGLTSALGCFQPCSAWSCGLWQQFAVSVRFP